MEEAPENSKESSYSAHGNGMNERTNECTLKFQILDAYKIHFLYCDLTVTRIKK
jgi:hypothetical protein